MKNFDLLSSQRYFHLIAFKYKEDFINNDYLKSIDISPRKNIEDIELNDILIRRMCISTGRPYHSGGEDFSIGKDGKAPFVYDFILILMKDKNIAFFCFPFKRISKEMIARLLKNHSLLKHGKFIKVDLNHLVKVDSPTDYLSEDISYYFNSVELALPGEVNLSSVKLEGDKPLDSIIYKEVFKNRILDDSGRVEKLSLKGNTSISKNEKLPSVRSSFHIDKYGNYKLYVQSTGINIITVPLVFYSFLDKECLIEISNNPTLVLTNTESD